MKRKKFFENLLIFLVLAFIFLPIIVLVVYSFNESSTNIVFKGFTLKWFKELFNNKDLIEAFFNTLLIAGISTVVSTIVGTVSAGGLHKYNFKLKGFINILLYIPIVITEIVLGISLLSMYTLMKMNLGIPTIILSHIVFSLPYVIVSVRSALTDEIASIEEASNDLGVGHLKTFWYVTLPAIMPGIISGASLAFTLSLDDVVISYFTAGPGSNTLPLIIYSIIKTGITPDVNALTTIVLLIVIGFLTIMTINDARKIKMEAKR